MKISKVNLVYFSATYTTRKVVRAFAAEFGAGIVEYDITQSAPDTEVELGSGELLVVGMPVYAGRIPAGMADVLKKFKGNDTPAVTVCVYGNRDYDDALLELKDTVEANGFRVVSAGTFVAQHSIFPQVGHARPDEKDMDAVKVFAGRTAALLAGMKDINVLKGIEVKGARPYKTPGKIPLKPDGNSRCDQCGTCVKLCPVQAIPADNPRKTDKDRCVSCGRCIVVCPQKARRFGGLVYRIAGKKFVNNFGGVRREPETAFAAHKTNG